MIERNAASIPDLPIIGMGATDHIAGMVASWFDGKEFSSDWTSHNIGIWVSLFSGICGDVRRVLEIGSWEGRSAIFFLKFFPNCTVTAIDTFGGTARQRQINPHLANLYPIVESRFDANVAEFGNRVHKLKGCSCAGLGMLAIKGTRFDFVYIDGSHHSLDVYADAAMSWLLLDRGGIMVFDDYEWAEPKAMIERPKPAIDAFLKALSGSYRLLYQAYQVIIQKTST